MSSPSSSSSTWSSSCIYWQGFSFLVPRLLRAPWTLPRSWNLSQWVDFQSAQSGLVGGWFQNDHLKCYPSNSDHHHHYCHPEVMRAFWLLVTTMSATEAAVASNLRHHCSHHHPHHHPDHCHHHRRHHQWFIIPILREVVKNVFAESIRKFWACF